MEDIYPCTIINEWVPRNLPLHAEKIIEEMKKVVFIVGDKKQNTQLYYEIFGKDCGEVKNRIPDYDPTDMLVSYSLKRV